VENILPWFALKTVPGIGRYLFKRLINHFNSPALVFEASTEELLKIEGISKRLVSAIKHHSISEAVKKEIDLVNQKGYNIVTMSDNDYPPLLLEIPDPPPFLYVCGYLEKSIKNIAIVGSRNATAYGISTTKELSSNLALNGITVVSGMAIGIDTAAHKGALDVKGRTIAVLGSGLERIYPPENKKLFYEIADNGAVVSEFPLMTEPESHNFPVRNRIISGISLGTVVVEATKKSGSLITARLAAEQNREVFAVPGSIHSFKSTGTHTLIKQGAKLVEQTQDIIEELAPLIENFAENKSSTQKKAEDNLPAALSSEELIVCKALGPYPVHIDNLVKTTSMEPGKLAGLLLELELKEIVVQTPGKFFSIKY